MAAARYRIPKYEGVYGYDSADRRHNGRPDTCFYITLKTTEGKKIWEKIGWQSEGYTAQLAAELRAKRIRDARHQGEIKTRRDLQEEQRLINRPLKEIAEHYFNSSRGLALRGRATDLSRWSLHLAPLEYSTVKEICQNDIDQLRKDMAEKKLSPATIDHALRLLRRIINHGVEHKLCPALSFKIKFKRVDNITTEFLNPDEAARLVATLDGWPRQDVARMVKIAMFSGMRRGEIFKLRRDDIDFEHSIIKLRDPKGGKGVSIPLSSVVRGLLEQQIDFLEKEEIRRERRYLNTTRPAPDFEDQGFIFPGKNGGQRKDCSAIEKIKAAAQLPEHFRPFHGLRHHFAVLLASSGEFNLDQIGQLLTHKSSDVTRRYAHFLPEAQQRAAKLATDIIGAHMNSNGGQAQEGQA